jgi:N-acetyltransferase 10
VVRIATHPDAHSMGYGTRALNLLKMFFLKELNSSDDQVHFYEYNHYSEDGTIKSLENSQGGLNETLEPRRKVKPLLKSLTEIVPPKMHYLGVSFGLTFELLSFWKKNSYEVVYIKQKANDITGEHSCIMLQDLKITDIDGDYEINSQWIQIMKADFEKRFVSLLGFNFRHFTHALCLEVLRARLANDTIESADED